MNTIIGELGKSQKFIEIINHVEKQKSPIAISGLTGVGMVQQLMGIHEFSKKPICIITYNEIQAKNLYDNMKNFTDKVVLFPKKEIVTYDYVAESKDIPYERIEALNEITSKRNLIVITTVEALMQTIPEKNVLYKNSLSFKVGEECNLEEVKQKLVDLGYVREDLIEGRGQFSIRGDIIDVSVTENEGLRIELWGDEIDSIRNFNIVTQRSIKNLEKAKVNPAHEFILENSVEEVCKKLNQIVRNVKEEQENKKAERFQDIIDEDIEQIESGNYISKIDKYFNCFYSNQANLIDYLNNNYVICIDELNKVEQRARNIKEDLKNLLKTLTEKEKFIPQALENMLSLEEVREQIEQNKNKKIYIEKEDKKTKLQLEEYHFNYKEVNYYKSDVETFIKDMHRYIAERKRVYVLTNSKEKAKKLQALLNQESVPNLFEEKLNQTIIVKSKESFVTVSVGSITEGFICGDLEQIIISADNLIDGERRKKRTSNKEFKEAEKVVFADLKIGDYVVHRTSGIGIYIGVNTIKADGTIKDYIKIKYKNDDILYVPTNQMDSVRKYIGDEGRAPKINRLGSKEWENTKARVKNNLREVAKELIELYAKREKTTGFAFSKDTPWQSEFEAKFPYQETEDQIHCIEEVKHDMEMQKPMDRLLCGDVGYGKTEVALRAAFKAVMDQKQVAYLAPTTILADQQYKEFVERMKDFPIRVEILNRFKSKKYQNEVVRKLKLGEVDIVIGTHRILSKDVEFKDLGLLIVDEEHRFGVKDKEKIKQYKTNVDVLTMTATPIPRTLHMSIVGIRDMSVIYEPPHNRKPVQTYVLEYDPEVVKEAITRELERGGQVFYLFNNVGQIESKVNQISALVPEAKVSFAHGKMSGSQVEEIMQEFVDGKTNVLVCTTILESGIDIPNANTIIVENADRLGLAQLYQIRGRVGRAEKQAYAYITYKRDKLLTEVADKRLRAIREFTEFGSGFKIAMRDLEIRGAGSLLGEIQSGHLEQVGYDTYCNLLDQVVKEMKGIKIEEEQDIQIDLDVTSYIPDEYISDSNQKIEVYQNIALCKNENDIQDIIDELIDRFGNMPKEVENLIKIARIKYLAKAIKVEKIASKKAFAVITFSANNFELDVNKLLKEYGTKIKFSPGVKPRITLDLKKENAQTLLKGVTEFLQKIKKV